MRFPTSLSLDGSDAVNPDPDYSATYVILKTNDPSGLEGHGLTFTIGRGNEICVAAVNAIKPFVIGLEIDAIKADMCGFWRSIAADSQLRWIGPEKGAIHLATAAVVNAVWDILAKEAGKPLWKLLVDMSPEEIIACIDFKYITDALTPDQAFKMLQEKASTKTKREAILLSEGYPAYTTSAGWLGYSDDKMWALCQKALAEGWQDFKLKVGADIEEDIRRIAIMRQEIGPDRRLMIDANQNWDVTEAIENMVRFAPYDPWWIEEPTSPDDILGHARIAKAIHPIGVATGEHCHNRVMFKQFFQAQAIQFCQLDSCRLGSINEILAVLLLAAKFNVPVCPHGGGVGLCEYIQHISMFDYEAVSGTMDNRTLEYVDHLHEHFINPVRMRKGRYLAPTQPGYSIEMFSASRDDHIYPEGPVWQKLKEQGK
ncbi:MAG: L-fuconate dehydratase [Opitutaceae bacterium]|nr:L-fuconate dehydratase [Opitutaceae bacterium]